MNSARLASADAVVIVLATKPKSMIGCPCRAPDGSMQKLKQDLKKLLKAMPGIEYVHELYYLLFCKDCSQYGEQGMLSTHLLPGQDTAAQMYLELGCNKPLRFSNTYVLYKQGWSGWCVDAGDFAPLWQFFRPRDRYIQRAVVPDADMREITFYEIQHTSLVATTDREHARQWAEVYGEVPRVRTVPCLTLTDLLTDFHQKYNCYPRLVLTDVEGLDDAILRSVSLHALREQGVEFVLLETLHSESETIQYLADSGYQLLDRAGNSLLFKAVHPSP